MHRIRRRSHPCRAQARGCPRPDPAAFRTAGKSVPWTFAAEKAVMIAVHPLHSRGPMNEQERPSKTRRKKEMHELQVLGERLVALHPGTLAHPGPAAKL